MQVLFESRDPGAAPLKRVAERRVRFALRRVAWVVSRVRVHLSDVNGPSGGTDKRCLLEVSTPYAGPVVVVSLAREWRAAFETALERATRAVLRAWRRVRDHGAARGALPPARHLRRGPRHA